MGKCFKAMVLTLPFGLAFLCGTGCERAAEAGANEASSPDRFFQVERRDMTAGVLESGTVNSRDKHKISLEAAVNTKIIEIVDENSEVKKGDLLVAFDDEELRDRVEDLELEVENGRKELQVAEEEMEIQQSVNDSSLRKARDAVVMAEENLYKYLRLEGPKRKDEQSVAVDNAREKYEEAQKKYEEAFSESKTKVYDNQEEQDAAEKNIESLRRIMEKEKINYENAQLDRKIFKRYTHPNRIQDLENSLEQAKLDLKQAEVRARSSMVQKESAVIRNRNNIRRDESNLKKSRAYLEMMQILSPVDGVVIYGDPDRRWNNADYRVGSDVRRGEVLMTIPDLGELLVDVDLPEIYRSRVAEGNRVLVTPDSMPGLTVEGTVVEIAALPVNQIFWDQTSPKIYKTRIEIGDNAPQLVTGMNVQVKIITAVLKDTLAVPVEAVFESEKGFYVYRRDGDKSEKVQIEIGYSDDDFVEVRDGLKPGDVIALYKPVK